LADAAVRPDAGPAPLTPLLELRGIAKSFPGVRALDDVSLPISSGEIHMLVGENGAGKSSLMKVLCGAYRADQGEVYYQGKRVEICSPADARNFGIAVIFQEFSLVPLSQCGAEHIPRARICRSHSRDDRPQSDRRRSHTRSEYPWVQYRSPHTASPAWRRSSANCRDRQGAIPESAHPGDGRADLRVVQPGNRALIESAQGTDNRTALGEWLRSVGLTCPLDPADTENQKNGGCLSAP
jgi:ABC-type dipeptide/oligopeptide/nickel transport system ATPase component